MRRAVMYTILKLFKEFISLLPLVVLKHWKPCLRKIPSEVSCNYCWYWWKGVYREALSKGCALPCLGVLQSGPESWSDCGSINNVRTCSLGTKLNEPGCLYYKYHSVQYDVQTIMSIATNLLFCNSQCLFGKPWASFIVILSWISIAIT